MKQQLLVIDDSKAIHPLVAALLASEPVEIHSAHDGQYGLVLAASLKPDLVLLDVEMPIMNGFETCKKLKAQDENASTPVIFLTALASTEEKIHGLNLGAVDYITKPFNRAELQARVRASLRTSQLIRLLEEKALIDPLTGMGNRAMFDSRLHAEISLRKRSGAPLSCLLLDVDGFKGINDRYGHPFGDRVLRGVAAAMTSVCRTEDVVCRLGGDEFAVLAPNTDSEQANQLAERLREAVAATENIYEGNPVRVTCSCGAAGAVGDGQQAIIERADEALYRAKDLGRNRVCAAESGPKFAGAKH